MSVFSTLLSDPALPPILGALPQARLVGGCVRDALAGLPAADIDIATPDPPDAAMARLERAGLRVVPTGLAHGTLTAISFGRAFEITTLRRDLATDGRHATVAWTDDFTADAARRDFTINAMSLDRNGALHDPFGGAADLAAGRVRFVGEAAARITEDYLRALRFFRFFARYGTGEPDAAAIGAIAANLDGLARLSAERVWSELKRILLAPSPVGAFFWMRQLGILAAILPEAGDTERLIRVVQAGAPADPILRLAALAGGSAAGLSDRLRLSAAERDLLVSLLAGPAPTADDDDDALRRALAATPAAILAGRTWLAGGGESVRARLATMPTPVFPLEGRHALALGAIPGKRLGQALRHVRAWWLKGGCIASEAACIARLASALETLPP